jgi:hypothetical protein
MAKVKVTVGQVQAKLGVNYAQAAGLMGVLVQTGQAVAQAEKLHKDGAKGKGATVYEVESAVTVQLV